MATTLKSRFFRRAERNESPGGQHVSSRTGLWLFAAAGLAVAAIGVLAVRTILARLTARGDGMETQMVSRGPLRVSITSEGNLSSGTNAELKCQVAGGGADHFDYRGRHAGDGRHRVGAA